MKTEIVAMVIAGCMVFIGTVMVSAVFALTINMVLGG